MYEDWPTLEFPDLNKSILDLFTKATSESVSASLLDELTRWCSEECDQVSNRLQTDEQLRWCMQVLNYSLTLSFTTHREYETIRGAVHIYLHWLRALTDTPGGNIPTPLLDTPEKYFRTIIDALRNLFCRRVNSKGEVSRGVAIERQAREVENVLTSIRDLAHAASRKYQNEVWTRTLSFLLNSADILLADPFSPEEMGVRVGSRVVDTLFDLWFHAVLNEEIPSPTYWRTLSALCRRWRHHITVVESWGRKLLAITVVVCRRMYGDEYCRILIRDDSITPFAFLPAFEDDGDMDLLYHSWFNLFSLLDSPVDILAHDPMRNKPISGGVPCYDESVEAPQVSASLPLCFFLAVTALQRMVDVFYGDSHVPIEFRESDMLVRKWTVATPTQQASISNDQTSGRIRKESCREKTSTGADSASGRDSRDVDGTLTHEDRASFSSSTSMKEGRGHSDLAKRSHRNSQTERTIQNDEHGVISTGVSQHVNVGNAYRQNHDQAKQSIVSSESSLRPFALQFVAHTLTVNPAYAPWVGEKGPRAENLLNVTMEWLLAAAQAKTDCKVRAEIADGK
ncbi:hypothetical protein KIN20_033209 [Parelaphostrongylus tenuis]|uniref:Ral GTPase-activating protein subunit alpha/beta N-terminal domain-containing protein n=1 Tax=Parelaphostrongylus tenuis TaxID=148309 RepID=A0AAD5R850_PARTN|nr:hypothetical protein KIN20_033209 [Parelaphostrongylus tenuis]